MKLKTSKKKKVVKYIVMFSMLTIIASSAVVMGNYLGKVNQINKESKAASYRLMCGFVNDNCKVVTYSEVYDVNNKILISDISKDGKKQCVPFNEMTSKQYLVVSKGNGEFEKIEDMSGANSFYLGCKAINLKAIHNIGVPMSRYDCTYCDNSCLKSNPLDKKNCNPIPVGISCLAEIKSENEYKCTSQKFLQNSIDCSFCEDKCVDKSSFPSGYICKTTDNDSAECIPGIFEGKVACVVRGKEDKIVQIDNPTVCGFCKDKCVALNELGSGTNCTNDKDLKGKECILNNSVCEERKVEGISIEHPSINVNIIPGTNKIYEKSIFSEIVSDVDLSNFKIEYSIDNGNFNLYKSPVKLTKTSNIKYRILDKDSNNELQEVNHNYIFVDAKPISDMLIKCNDDKSTTKFEWKGDDGYKLFVINLLDSSHKVIKSYTSSQTYLELEDYLINKNVVNWEVIPLLNSNLNLSDYLQSKDNGKEEKFIKCDGLNDIESSIDLQGKYTNSNIVKISGELTNKSSIFIDGNLIYNPEDNSDDVNTWTTNLTLNEYGKNSFKIWTENKGIKSRVIDLDIYKCEEGDLNCDNIINIFDFALFNKFYEFYLHAEKPEFGEYALLKFTKEGNFDSDFGIFQSKYFENNFK